MTESNVLGKAALLCLRNARQYIKDADLLCAFNSYGHALALVVMSDVELGKAVVYHLWSKDLISGETLPLPLQTYFLEKRYGLFASETWWVGFVLASKIEELVQDLLDASEMVGEAAASCKELTAPTMKRIAEIVERMRLESGKLTELEADMSKGSFVDFSIYDVSVVTPEIVEKSIVKRRIQDAKHRVRVGTPYLSLSLSDVPNRIARILLEEAFKNALPLRDRIRQFTLEGRKQTNHLSMQSEGVHDFGKAFEEKPI